jgi:putative nucleotidyltransferase with HDIG domain
MNNGELQLKPFIKKLSEIRNLPSIPTLIMEVSDLIENPRTSASELAGLISRDQGMVTKILTVANSPFYGLPRKVSTIEFAIVILGFQNIKSIIIALSMIDSLRDRNGESSFRKKYWNHSLAVASIARRIANDLGYVKSGEAFIAGLLHDLGISVIQSFFPDEYKQIKKIMGERNEDYLSAEFSVLNSTHQEIGHFLSEKWGLPSQLGSTILFHHHPEHAVSHQELVSIVHLADYITGSIDLADYYCDKDSVLDKSIIKRLRFGNEELLNEHVRSYKTIFKNSLELIIKN